MHDGEQRDRGTNLSVRSFFQTAKAQSPDMSVARSGIPTQEDTTAAAGRAIHSSAL
jgi:hypothetical protein